MGLKSGLNIYRISYKYLRNYFKIYILNSKDILFIEKLTDNIGALWFIFQFLEVFFGVSTDISALVTCDCYIKGKTKTFPIPQFEQYFYLDDDGYFDLHLNYKEFPDEHAKIWKWMDDACEHERMEYMWVHFGSLNDYLYFWQIIERMGAKLLPTLFEEFQDPFVGNILPLKAERILKELVIFRQNLSEIELPFLIDSQSGKVLRRYIASQLGLFYSVAGRSMLGIDHKGFFVAKEHVLHDWAGDQIDESKILFRSMRFEQKSLEKSRKNGQTNKVRFHDSIKEQSFVGNVPIFDFIDKRDGNLETILPTFLHVELQSLSESTYTEELSAIEAICNASIQTGNPVIWVSG